LIPRETRGLRFKTTGRRFRADNSSTWNVTSDRRLKTGVHPIVGGLNVVERLNPVRFHYNAEYLAAHPGAPNHEFFGVVAQEYAEVFPDFVPTDADGYLGVNCVAAALCPHGGDQGASSGGSWAGGRNRNTQKAE